MFPQTAHDITSHCKRMGFNTEKEVRDGYTVTAEMKKIWAVELDLLREFLDFCRRNGLRCWAEGGTLLGAVRHKGFIPWDDDIDLMMPREDYDRMNRMGNSQFHPPYFLQTAYTDKAYYRSHAQFRNSDTAAIRPSDSFQPFNQGIFIDIFVIDGVPPEGRGPRLDSMLKRCHRPLKLLKARHMNVLYSGRLGQVFRKMKATYMVRRHGWEAIYRKSEDAYREVAWEDTDKVAELTQCDDKFIVDKGIFDETVWLDFEDIKIPAPKRYDEFLRLQFGDSYMTPVMAPNMHGTVVFSTEESYDKLLPRVRREYKRSALKRLRRKILG